MRDCWPLYITKVVGNRAILILLKVRQFLQFSLLCKNIKLFLRVLITCINFIYVSQIKYFNKIINIFLFHLFRNAETTLPFTSTSEKLQWKIKNSEYTSEIWISINALISLKPKGILVLPPPAISQRVTKLK